MIGLFRFIGLVAATALLFALFTRYQPGTGDAKTVILGLPVVSVAQVGAFGWIGLGQAAGGVLVIAQGGAGLVAFVQGGAGLFFGIGQLMFSFAAIAQVGVGAFFFVGQGGVGAQAAGQGVWKRRSKEYFQEMSADFNDLLRPPFSLRKR
jgi:hypothetical protein